MSHKMFILIGCRLLGLAVCQALAFPCDVIAADFSVLFVKQPCYSAVLLPDDTMVFATRSGVGHLTDFRRRPIGLELLGDYNGRVTNLALDDARKQLSACGDDGMIHVWDVATLKETHKMAIEPTAVDLAMSGDGRFLSAATSKGIRLWERKDGDWAACPALKEGDGDALSVVFRPNSDEIVGGFSNGVVRRWDLEDGDMKVALVPHGKASRVRKMCFSPDGVFLVTASDRHLAITDVTTKTTSVKKLVKLEATSLAFVNFGTDLVSGDKSGRVIYWNAARDFTPYRYEYERHKAAVFILLQRKDCLVTGGEDGLLIQTDLY